MAKIERIGDAVLYCADCMDILPTLDPVEAVVTDPPYGIGAYSTSKMGRGVLGPTSVAAPTTWDVDTQDEAVNLAIGLAKYAIVFGGNFYDLPPSSCWLVWDKENGTNDFADCELAWTNLPKAVRRLRFMWHGMLRANGEKRGDHPTQKPVGVMQWAIQQLPSAETILDPFMGSGTTGVACSKMGRKFIGIERERKYFDVACKRIEDAYRQGDMFIPSPSRRERESAENGELFV